MRRHISKEVKEMAFRMSLESGLGDTKIAEYTGIRPSTLRCLRKHFRETGEIGCERPSQASELVGCHGK